MAACSGNPIWRSAPGGARRDRRRSCRELGCWSQHTICELVSAVDAALGSPDGSGLDGRGAVAITWVAGDRSGALVGDSLAVAAIPRSPAVERAHEFPVGIGGSSLF